MSISLTTDNEQTKQIMFKCHEQLAQITIQLSELYNQHDDLKSIQQKFFTQFGKDNTKSNKASRQLLNKLYHQAQQLLNQFREVDNLIQSIQDTAEKSKLTDLYILHYKEFQETWRLICLSQQNHHQNCQKLFKQMYSLTHPTANETELATTTKNAVANYLNFDQVFNQSAGHASLNYIEDKHQQIIKIEKSIEDVQHLFIDLQILIENQSQVVNHTQAQIDNAKNDIVEGIHQLKKAQTICKK